MITTPDIIGRIEDSLSALTLRGAKVNVHTADGKHVGEVYTTNFLKGTITILDSTRQPLTFRGRYVADLDTPLT